MKQDMLAEKQRKFRLLVAELFGLSVLYLAFLVLPASAPVHGVMLASFLACRVFYLSRVIEHARTSVLRATLEFLEVTRKQEASK